MSTYGTHGGVALVAPTAHRNRRSAAAFVTAVAVSVFAMVSFSTLMHTHELGLQQHVKLSQVQQHVKLSQEDLKLTSQIVKFRELVKDQALLVTQMGDSGLKRKAEAELIQMQGQLQHVLDLQRQRQQYMDPQYIATSDTRKEAGAQLKSFFLDTFKLPFTSLEEQKRQKMGAPSGGDEETRGQGSINGAAGSQSSQTEGNEETTGSPGEGGALKKGAPSGEPAARGIGETPSGGESAESESTDETPAEPSSSGEPAARGIGDRETPSGGESAESESTDETPAEPSSSGEPAARGIGETPSGGESAESESTDETPAEPSSSGEPAAKGIGETPSGGESVESESTDETPAESASSGVASGDRAITDETTEQGSVGEQSASARGNDDSNDDGTTGGGASVSGADESARTDESPSSAQERTKVSLVCDAVTKAQCEALSAAERTALLGSVQSALRVRTSSTSDLIADASLKCGSIVITGYATSDSVFGLLDSVAKCDKSQLIVSFGGSSLPFCMKTDTGTDAAAVAAAAASLANSPTDAAIAAAGEDLEAKIASAKAKLAAAIAAGDHKLAASLRKGLKKLRKTQIARAKDALAAAVAAGDEATAASLREGIAALENMEDDDSLGSDQQPAGTTSSDAGQEDRSHRTQSNNATVAPENEPTAEPAATSRAQARVDTLRKRIAEAQRKIDAAVAAGDEARANSLRKGLADLYDQLDEAEADAAGENASPEAEPDDSNYYPWYTPPDQHEPGDGNGTSPNYPGGDNQSSPYFPGYTPGFSPDYPTPAGNTSNETESWNGDIFDDPVFNASNASNTSNTSNTSNASNASNETESWDGDFEIQEMNDLVEANAAIDNMASAELSSLNESAAAELQAINDEAQERLDEMTDMAVKLETFSSFFDSASSNSSGSVDVAKLQLALASLASDQTEALPGNATPISTVPTASPNPKNSTAVPAGATKAILALPMAISEIPEGSPARAAFETNFKTDVARNLGLDFSRVMISSIHAGSVVVEFHVLPDASGLPFSAGALESKLAVGAQIAGQTLMAPVARVETIAGTTPPNMIVVSDLQRQVREAQSKIAAATAAGLTDRVDNLKRGMEKLQKMIHDTLTPTLPAVVVTTAAPQTVSLKSQIAQAKSKIKKTIAMTKVHGLGKNDRTVLMQRVASLRAGLQRLDHLMDSGASEIVVKAPVPAELKQQLAGSPPFTPPIPPTPAAAATVNVSTVTMSRNTMYSEAWRSRQSESSSPTALPRSVPAPGAELQLAKLNLPLQAKIDHAKARLQAVIHTGNNALADSLQQGIDKMEETQKEQVAVNAANEFPAAAPLTPLTAVAPAPPLEMSSKSIFASTHKTTRETGVAPSDFHGRISSASRALKRAIADGDQTLIESLKKGLSHLKTLQANEALSPQKPFEAHQQVRRNNENTEMVNPSVKQAPKTPSARQAVKLDAPTSEQHLSSRLLPSSSTVEGETDVATALEQQIKDKKVTVIEAMKKAEDARLSGLDATALHELENAAVSQQRGLAKLRIAHAKVKVAKALNFAQSEGLTANERLKAEAHAVSLQRGLANLESRMTLLGETAPSISGDGVEHKQANTQQ